MGFWGTRYGINPLISADIEADIIDIDTRDFRYWYQTPLADTDIKYRDFKLWFERWSVFYACSLMHLLFQMLFVRACFLAHYYAQEKFTSYDL